MTADSTEKASVLERNVDQLLKHAHEPPKMDPEARARVLGSLRQNVEERRRAESPAGKVRLGRVSIFAFGTAAALAAGLLLFSGDRGSFETVRYLNPDEAPLVVELHDGSSLVLKSGAEVVIDSLRSATLVSGEVLFDIAPGETQFVVQSEHGQAQVLGTRFVMSTVAERTVAAVVRGRVRLTNRHGSTTLGAGEQGVIERRSGPVRGPAPRLSHLTSWAKGARKRKENKERGPARRGTLFARNPGWQQQEFPLPMRELIVDVHIENQIARVAFDQTFFNHRQQQLEGVYHFALPPEAAISRLAMYVDGTLTEAGVVERQRGREVYESIVYRRRDPALLEWMAGNVFKVRIFPLPGRTDKRILMSYTQPLQRLYDVTRLEVPIPEIDDPVERVTYRVRVADCGECDIVSSSHRLEVTRDGDDAVATFTASNHEIGDDLLLTIRRQKAASRVTTMRKDGHSYWMARLRPQLDPKPDARPTPRRWVIVHDTSASRGRLELEAQSHLIDRLLLELDEFDEVAIAAFDTTIRWHGDGFTRVDKVDRLRVAQFLAKQSADGVGLTDLHQVFEEALQRLGRAGDDMAPHILYLGDGIVTGGQREIDELTELVATKATVVSVAVGERQDARMLKALASATGGAVITINPGEDLDWRAFDLVAMLHTPRVTELSALLLSSKGVIKATAYASSHQVASGEEITLIARDASGVTQVWLSGRLRGEPWEQTFEVGDVHNGSAGYLPRLWAQQRIDSLLAEGEESKKEVTELAMKHWLITPHTSLIVLENDAMYKQYKVARSSDRGWAAYAAPKKIDVVRVPVKPGKPTVFGRNLDIVTRAPVVWVTHPYARFGANKRRNAAFLPIRQLWTQSLSLPIGGESFLLDGRWSDRQLSGLLGNEIGEMGWRDGDLDGSSVLAGTLTPFNGATMRITTGPVPVTEVNGRLFDDTLRNGWTVKAGQHRIDFGASMNGQGFQPGTWSALQFSVDEPRFFNSRFSFDAGLDMNLARGAIGGLRGHNGYFALSPLGLTYPTDRRYHDLTLFVRGLFSDALDQERFALNQIALEDPDLHGSVSAEARELIAAARAHAAMRRYVRDDDGSTIVIGSNGHFRAERRGGGLTEIASFDGKDLVQLYPELGIAARRPVGDAATSLYAQWAPFMLPPASSIARWYNVTARDGVLELRDTKGVLRFELVLDKAHRLVEVRRVNGKKRLTTLSFSWSDDAVVVTSLSGELTYKAERFSLAIDPVDVSAAVVIEMPLRPAQRVLHASRDSSGTEWRRSRRQLLATYAATANITEGVKVVRELIDDGRLSIGELVLATPFLDRLPNSKDFDRALAGQAAHPVAIYLRAGRDSDQARKIATFDRIARKSRGTMVAMLAAHRSLMHSITVTRDNKAYAQYRRFFADYKNHDLTYIAMSMMRSYVTPPEGDSVASAWDSLADGPYWYHAGYEAARAESTRGAHDKAVERLEKLTTRALANGWFPAFDWSVANSFRQSSRGEAGWKLFWNRLRDRVIASNDASMLLGFMRASQRVGQQAQLDRISSRVTELSGLSPRIAVAFANAFLAAGRAADADAVLSKLVGTLDGDVPAAMLERMSAIAASLARPIEAADYFQRAMDSYQDRPVALNQVRADFSRLINLHLAVMRKQAGEERQAALERALSTATDWRRVDPDNSAIDTLIAKALYAIGDDERAWRQLSSTIERHPMEGSSYSKVAEVLEAEGLVDRAEGVWANAARVEPTNPTWLLRRSQAMSARGDRQRATKILDQIIEGEWQDRFSNITYQAKRLRDRKSW